MNKPNIFIISAPHLNADRKLWLGGLDKYTDTLATKLAAVGYKVYFHEISVSGRFEINRNGFLEVGHDLPRDIKKSIPKIQKNIKKLPYYSANDIVIYSTDYLAAFNKMPNAIAIQHGIAWDVPFERESIRTKLKPHFLFESKIKILKNIEKLVCVDYNYLNWFRATYPLDSLLQKITVVTNFTKILRFDRKVSEPESRLKICFARRFEDYRGAMIFAKAICRLQEEPFFHNLDFVFAGKGKREADLKRMFARYPNVKFKKYEANEALSFHSDFDIAVVPTIGSEGTSLSALEAMSSGCAVVCTSVGGLSNIVINKHNGLLIEPNSQSICQAIKELYFDRSMLFDLQLKGHETVETSFDEDAWFKKWSEVIESFCKA